MNPTKMATKDDHPMSIGTYGHNNNHHPALMFLLVLGYFVGLMLESDSFDIRGGFNMY